MATTDFPVQTRASHEASGEPTHCISQHAPHCPVKNAKQIFTRPQQTEQNTFHTRPQQTEQNTFHTRPQQTEHITYHRLHVVNVNAEIIQGSTQKSRWAHTFLSLFENLDVLIYTISSS